MVVAPICEPGCIPGSHVVVTPPFESCSQHNGDLYPIDLFAED